MNIARRLLEVGVVFLAGACASTASMRGAPVAAHDARIFRGDGNEANWDALVDAAAASEVVLIGENHGHPLGLATAARLFDAVLARAPMTSLSLEFFERDDQSRIDDYLQGLSDGATFERRTGRNEGSYPPGHRAMLEAARKAGRPVHGANAPRALVRVARTEGYARLRALTAEQQRLLRIPDELVVGRYREAFDKVMTPEDRDVQAPEERERLDAVFRSQQLWDWTMADAVVDALELGESPVVHVVGRFHVDHDGGTAQVLRKLRPGTKTLVVSFVDAWSDTLAADDASRGDFVIYVGPSEGE